MGNSKDLFDDTTMSFGEHLEVLRAHLIKSLLGLAIAVIVCLFYGDTVIAILRRPLDAALLAYGMAPSAEEEAAREALEGFSFTRYLKTQIFGPDWANKPDPKNAPDGTAVPEGTSPPGGTADPAGTAVPAKSESAPQVAASDDKQTLRVEVRVAELARAIHQVDPERYPVADAEDDRRVALHLSAPEFSGFRHASETVDRPKPVALSVQEAFGTYVKVSCVTGLIVASPWVFFQIWQFVAAGLYPHERRYVYVYLPMSIGLFLVGCVFCYYGAFPFMLKFLLNFNRSMQVDPQIRLTEWISFAITLPLLFGASFQLPLVMLFLERISVFDAQGYAEKRRMAVLVIAVVSMILTPPDPMSMMLMMIPMLGLYELGILLCKWSPAQKSPFGEEVPA